MDIQWQPNNNIGPGNDKGFAAEDAKYGGAITTALNYVTNLFDKLFTNNVTIKVQINWDSKIGNGARNGSFLPTVYAPYDQVRSALITNATNSLQQTAYNSTNLPSTDPNSSRVYALRPAYAAAIGLKGYSGLVDQTQITFNSSWFPWNFLPNGNPDPTSTDAPFIGLFDHEFTEIMGREASVGTAGNQYEPIDLWRYSQPGTRQTEIYYNSNSSVPTTGYFSVDGGTTFMGGGFFDNVFGTGDAADWGPDIVPNDSFGPSPPGTDWFSLQDLRMMNVLGWNISSSLNEVPQGITDFVEPPRANFQTYSNTFGIAPFDPNQPSMALDQLGDGMTVDSGGRLDVVSGGTAGTVTGNTVLNGGYLKVEAGGTASGTVLKGGALLTDYGSAANTKISKIAFEDVYGSDTNAKVLGEQIIYSGGAADGSVVSSGGIVIVQSGGTISGAKVRSGGTEYDGGNAYGGAVAGKQYVNSGGNATSVTVDHFGSQTVNVGGSTDNTVLTSGYEYLSGTATDTIVNSNGYLYVDGGQATGTIINSGGIEHDQKAQQYSANSIDAIVNNGGYQYVDVDGLAYSTNINSGGNQVVQANATTEDTFINSAGTQYVNSGGIAEVTLINTGGTEYVEAGGESEGVTFFGGTADFTAGALSTFGNGVTFAGTSGGTLQLDSNYSNSDPSFSGAFGPIRGFGTSLSDQVDLSTIAYGPQDTVVYLGQGTDPNNGGNFANSVIGFSDGVDYTQLLLVGQYIASSFSLASDGHGGTLVTERVTNPGGGGLMVAGSPLGA
jgi:autotransporter passenger strand-loop-strand repeat protein